MEYSEQFEHMFKDETANLQLSLKELQIQDGMITTTEAMELIMHAIQFLFGTAIKNKYLLAQKESGVDIDEFSKDFLLNIQGSYEYFVFVSITAMLLAGLNIPSGAWEKSLGKMNNYPLSILAAIQFKALTGREVGFDILNSIERNQNG